MCGRPTQEQMPNSINQPLPQNVSFTIHEYHYETFGPHAAPVERCVVNYSIEFCTGDLFVSVGCELLALIFSV